jgi:hypothetical protein
VGVSQVTAADLASQQQQAADTEKDGASGGSNGSNQNRKRLHDGDDSGAALVFSLHGNLTAEQSSTSLCSFAAPTVVPS